MGMLAAAPAAAQTYRLSYAEDCSRADSALVQESCDGKRETRLRERLRQIGMQPAARPQDAAYHLVLAVTIGYSGWYEEEVRSGKRVRDLTQTRVAIAVKRNDTTLAESTVDLDSQQCGTDADEAPDFRILRVLL